MYCTLVAYENIQQADRGERRRNKNQTATHGDCTWKLVTMDQGHLCMRAHNKEEQYKCHKEPNSSTQ